MPDLGKPFVSRIGIDRVVMGCPRPIHAGSFGNKAIVGMGETSSILPEPVRIPYWATTKVAGSVWGGLPQRSQRAQRGLGKGGMQFRQSCFLQLPWSAENDVPKTLPPNKAWIRGMAPTHPRCQIENATAISAGGSPDGGDSRRDRRGRRGV